MNKKQLWNSILQQAISGKLVPQLDTEAAVEQIGTAPAPDEVPFELPEKWKWVQLKHLNLASFSGGTPTKNNPDYWNGTIPWASIKDLSVDSEELNATKDHITEKGVANSSTKLVEANNIIVGMRMGLDKIAINKISVAINQDLRAFYLDYKLIDPKFFIKFYKTLRFEGSGTTVKGIKKNELMVLLVPLPPLEEQRRIVTKLDELKPLVDQFGEAYDKLSELEADFPRKLKASILQAAMQGKLVPQQDTEPAVEQLGPAPSPDEVPFALPEKWKWVQAKYMGSWKSGATPRRDNAEFWKNGTVPWLKTGEVSNGLVLATEEFVTEKAVKQARLRLNPEGSVLIAMYGTGTVGNIGILGIPCTTNQACCACITDSYVVINWFLFYVLIAFRALLINKAAGTTNLQNLSKDKIEKIWVPLPPLEEQRRIVERIEQLFAEVDKMSACKAP